MRRRWPSSPRQVARTTRRTHCNRDQSSENASSVAGGDGEAVGGDARKSELMKRYELMKGDEAVELREFSRRLFIYY